MSTDAKPLWMGREMIVWGGLRADYAGTNTGSRYDLNDTWVATNLTSFTWVDSG